jgi:hypothetical protein
VQPPGAQGAGKVAEEKVRVLIYLTLSRVRRGLGKCEIIN